MPPSLSLTWECKSASRASLSLPCLAVMNPAPAALQMIPHIDLYSKQKSPRHRPRKKHLLHNASSGHCDLPPIVFRTPGFPHRSGPFGPARGANRTTRRPTPVRTKFPADMWKSKLNDPCHTLVRVCLTNSRIALHVSGIESRCSTN